MRDYVCSTNRTPYKKKKHVTPPPFDPTTDTLCSYVRMRGVSVTKQPAVRMCGVCTKQPVCFMNLWYRILYWYSPTSLW